LTFPEPSPRPNPREIRSPLAPVRDLLTIDKIVYWTDYRRIRALSGRQPREARLGTSRRFLQAFRWVLPRRPVPDPCRFPFL